MKLNEKCERVIRGWSQWSAAERLRMDDVVEEIMDHVRNGGGNPFVASWVNRVLLPAIDLRRGDS